MSPLFPFLAPKPIIYRNLVFKGGGVRGIAYIGALEVLEEEGVLTGIQRVAGTSAGAISALLVSLRLPIDEVLELFSTLDFRKIPQSSTRKRKLPTRLPTDEEKLARIIRSYGLYSSEYFYGWLREVVAKHCDGNADASFMDFHKRGFLDPFIVVANLNKQREEIMSFQTTPDIAVADAVRMSMSIPLYFEALRFDGKKFGNGDYYVDGGLFNNYPIKVFDEPPYLTTSELKRTKGNQETLGLFLYPDSSSTSIKRSSNPRNLMDYLSLVMSNVYSSYEVIQYETSIIDQRRTIAISDRGIQSTDFDIVKGDEKYNLLRESGKKAAYAFLANR
ncbi:MAG TPA: hypothetical protein DCK95_05060 [Anaerolineaceae bacterium]|nr:hypothetical protein [Anaerolineaceae bacterium]